MKTCWNCDLQNIVNEKVNILCVIDNVNIWYIDNDNDHRDVATETIGLDEVLLDPTKSWHINNDLKVDEVLPDVWDEGQSSGLLK